MLNLLSKEPSLVRVLSKVLFFWLVIAQIVTPFTGGIRPWCQITVTSVETKLAVEPRFLRERETVPSSIF